jgi:hypothetical protein
VKLERIGVAEHGPSVVLGLNGLRPSARIGLRPELSNGKLSCSGARLPTTGILADDRGTTPVPGNPRCLACRTRPLHDDDHCELPFLASGR